MDEQEQIEQILTEASSYGLRGEVVEWAKSLIETGYQELEAYEEAFNEWVK